MLVVVFGCLQPRVTGELDVTDAGYAVAGPPEPLECAELATKYRLNRSLDGVVITSIVAGGPADRAGLREGDLVVEINRTPTTDLEQFNEQVRNLKKGSTFLLRVVRENRSFCVGFKL